MPEKTAEEIRREGFEQLARAYAGGGTLDDGRREAAISHAGEVEYYLRMSRAGQPGIYGEEITPEVLDAKALSDVGAIEHYALTAEDDGLKKELEELAADLRRDLRKEAQRLRTASAAETAEREAKLARAYIEDDTLAPEEMRGRVFGKADAIESCARAAEDPETREHLEQIAHRLREVANDAAQIRQAKRAAQEYAERAERVANVNSGLKGGELRGALKNAEATVDIISREARAAVETYTTPEARQVIKDAERDLKRQAAKLNKQAAEVRDEPAEFVPQRGANELRKLAKAGGKRGKVDGSPDPMTFEYVEAQTIEDTDLRATDKALSGLNAETKAFFNLLAGRVDGGEAYVSFEEWAELRGKPNDKRLRKEAFEYAAAVSRIQYHAQWSKSAAWVNFLEAVYLDKGKKGGIRAQFSKPFATALGRAAIYQAPRELYGYKHPYTYEVGQYLFTRTTASAARGYTGADRLSVAKVLENAPSIPSPEAVRNGNQTAQIIKPMQAALEELVELGFLRAWDYCRAKGAPAPPEWLYSMADRDGSYSRPLPWDMAKDAYITWEPAKAWYSPELEARRKKRIEDQAKKRAKEKGKK